MPYRPVSFCSRCFAPIAVLLASVLWASVAGAAVAGVAGNLMLITPPSDVSDGALESNIRLYLFEEAAGVELGSAINLVSATPSLALSGAAVPSTTALAAGSIVDSFMVHGDRRGSRRARTLSGSVTFDSDVLGILVTAAQLDATDTALGGAAVTYDTGNPIRGLDIAADTVSISADLRTVWFNFSTSTVDQVRIVTAGLAPPAVSSVPVPAGGLLLVSALALLRQRRRAA